MRLSLFVSFGMLKEDTNPLLALVHTA